MLEVSLVPQTLPQARLSILDYKRCLSILDYKRCALKIDKRIWGRLCGTRLTSNTCFAIMVTRPNLLYSASCSELQRFNAHAYGVLLYFYWNKLPSSFVAQDHWNMETVSHKCYASFMCKSYYCAGAYNAVLNADFVYSSPYVSPFCLLVTSIWNPFLWWSYSTVLTSFTLNPSAKKILSNVSYLWVGNK